MPMITFVLALLVLVGAQVFAAPAAETPSSPPQDSAAGAAQQPESQSTQTPAGTQPSNEPQETPTYEEQVVVTASRTEERLVNAPATVSLITPQTIQASPAQNY